MTVVTSQKESAEPTKVPPAKILDASSVSLGPDYLYQHPPPIAIHDYLEQRRHNRAWLRQCFLHWCGKTIIAVSIAVMLFALIVLLLSWADGYPSTVDRRPYEEIRSGSHLQRIGAGENLERMEPREPSDSVPDFSRFNRYPRRNETELVSDDEPSYFSIENALRAMRQRFQNVFRHMHELMGNTNNLPAPSAKDNDTEVIRRVSIDGTNFVQTRQVLKKQLPDGEGVIVVVRQQLIPVDEFYGNGTTTSANEPTEATATTSESNQIDDDEP